MRSLALQKELDKALTMADLAARFNVSLMTIHNWRVKQGLPALVMLNSGHRSAIRFILADVDAWAKENNHVIAACFRTGKTKKLVA